MSQETFLDPEAFAQVPPARDRSAQSVILLWACILICAAGLASQVVYVRGLWYRFFVSAEPPSVTWRASFVDAVAEADQTGKPLLISFVSASSPYSLAMRQEVWGDPRLRPIVASLFIPVRISADANPDLASDFHVKDTPTVIVLSGKNERLRETGFVSAYDLAFRLPRVMESPTAIR